MKTTENKQKQPQDAIEWFLNMNTQERTNLMNRVIHNATQDQLKILNRTPKE